MSKEKCIFTDEQRLKQIILNLLSNAIKFTSARGEISIFVEDYYESQEIFEKQLKISVQDTGIGMNQKNSADLRAFLKQEGGPFIELNQTGFCLGLYISSLLSTKLIKQKDSKTTENLSFITKENFGSTFSFVINNLENNINSESCEQFKLQLFEEEKQHQKFQDDSLIPTEFSDRIFNLNETKIPKIFKQKLLQKGQNQCNCSKCLIVDDDTFNLIVLEKLLNRLGFTCKKAYNGQEAIDELKQYYSQKCQFCQGYQIIWMDFQMPVMDGVTAANIISGLIKNNELPEIPIIACTAFNSKNDIEQCYASGMVDFVQKPISFDKIKNIMKKFHLM